MRRFLIEFLAAKVLKDLNMMAVEDLRVSKFSLGHTKNSKGFLTNFRNPDNEPISVTSTCLC